MSTIRVGDVAKQMAAAAAGVLKEKWPDAKDYAESEMKKLAESLAMLSKGVAKGTITKKSAKLLLEIHKHSTKAVLLTIEGLGLLMVEAAINAALKVVKDVVNTAAGVAIL